MNAATGAEERLIVMLEARVAEFEKRMVQAERRGARTYQGLRTASRSATRQMETDMARGAARINQALASATTRVGAFARAFAVGFGASLFAGITSNLRGIIGSIADLADAADQIGMSVTNLQGLQMGFKLAGVEIGRSTEGLRTFVDRLGDAAEGQGKLAEAFVRNGVALRDQDGMMRDTYDLLRDYAEIVKNAPDAATKMALATEAFGRGGKAMVTALAQGRDGMDEMIRAAEAGGHVLDEELVRKAAELDDRFDLLAQKAGIYFKTMVVGVADATAKVAGLRKELDDMLANEGRARALLGDEVYERLDRDRQALAEHEEAIRDLDYVWQDLARTVSTTTGAMGGDIAWLAELGRDDLATALADVSSRMDQLVADLDAGRIGSEDFTTELTLVTAEATKLLQEAAAIDGVTMDGIIGQVGRLTAALQIAREWAAGLKAEMPGGAPSLAGPGWEDRGRNPPPTFTADPNAPGNRPRPAPTDIDFDLGRPPRRGGGGGGGGGDAGRLDSLIGELQTERELLTLWYEESLELLNGATERELEALGGKHEAIERLEREHRERMAGIQTAAQDLSLQGVLSGGAEILGAMGAFNEKALRISKAFAAAEALVSTYQGAAEELKKGTFGFASASAVIAKGMGFIAAIKGASVGGMSGGGGGGVAAPAPAASPPQTMNLRIDVQGSDAARIATRTLIEQINEAAGQGYRVNPSLIGR